MIVVLEDNVMFSMPLIAASKARGVAITVVETADEVLACMNRDDIRAVLLDMRLTTTELMSQLPTHIPVAAFGPHVEGQMFLEMRRQGIREVWPNSKLHEKFPRWLDEVAHPPH